MDKTQDALDLYFLTRNVTWRYKLDQYEDATIAEMLKTVRSTVSEIKREIFDGDAPANADALVVELEALSAGLRKKIGEDVATMSGVAAEYSATEHAAIMSLDGAVKINTVALSAAQFQSFLGGSSGGTPLPQWVDDAWGHVVSDKIKRNLNIAVLRGEGYQKAVRGLLDSTIADFTEREAVTIARTYVQTANVAAQMAVYQANDDLVKAWRWSSVLEPGYSKTGRGTCLRCASLDQSQFKMGEGPPIPLHPRCVTGDTLISAPGVVAAIRIKYSGPIIDIRIDGGHTLSCTPNHRIMTSRGVMFAGDIQKGDKAVYDRAHAEGLRGSKNHYGLPTKAEDVFNFLADRFELFKAEPAASGVDLHGDELFVDGDIDIVAPKSLLRGDFETLLFQDLKDMFLPGSDVSDVFLPGLGKSTSMLIRLGLSAQSIGRFLSVFDAFLFCHSGESKRSGMAMRAYLDSVVGKVAPDGSLVGPEMIRDFIRTKAAGVHGDNFLDGELDRIWMLCSNLAALHGRSSFVVERDSLTDKSAFDWLSSPPEDVANLFLGLSSSVELRDVEFVGERSFNGHVYDLQSISSTYYNEGMLSSNCRCVALPVLKSWRELGLDRDELDAAIRPYTIRPDANIDAGGMRTIIESGRHQGDYASWWAKQPKAFQVNAVGPGRFELLQNGKISFSDLVDDMGRQRPISELEKIIKGKMSKSADVVFTDHVRSIGLDAPLKIERFGPNKEYTNVEVKYIPRAGSMKFEVLKDGTPVLYADPIWERNMDELRRSMLSRSVQDYLSPLEENIFVRAAPDKKDYDFLKSGTHRGSKNWSTGEMENGLSVAKKIEVPTKYTYYVKGTVIGEGSDGEPILDVLSARPVGKLKKYDDFYDEFRAAQYRKGKLMGFTEAEVKALLTSKSLVK